MGRYYGFKSGHGPNQYADLGFMTEALSLTTQSSGSYNIAFNMAEPHATVAAQSQFPVVSSIPALNASALDLLAGPSAADAAEFFFGAPSPMSVISSPTSYSDSREYKIRADLESWKTTSDAKNIDNWPEYLQSPASNGENSWLNWQAYVMGDERITFDGAARKFPGIFGPGQENVFFFDHAFERSLPDAPLVSCMYNYYDPFFDALKDQATILETYVPNYYLVNSVCYAAGTSSYSQLFPGQTAHAGFFGTSGQQVVKDLLSDVCGPRTSPQTTDILGAGNVTLSQIPAGQQADSVLSRFTRKDFTDTQATGTLQSVHDINKHIGIPRLMLAGGANSVLETMNQYKGEQFPCYLKVPITIPPNSGLDVNIEADVADQESYLDFWSNFFLYEIMQANINNFSNLQQYDVNQLEVYGPDQKYDDLDLHATVTPTSGNVEYYGFEGVNSGNWDKNPGAREPYSLRSIDLTNLFKNMFQYQYNQASGMSNYGYGPQSYNGFMGQSTQKNVADSQGIVVGEGFMNAALATNTLAVLTAHANEIRFDVDPTDLSNMLIGLADNLNIAARSYNEILQGHTAPKWTLAYKLDKHSVTSTGQVSEDPIQSIYFSNVEGVHNYVDTQVFFGKKYIYKLYAYDLVAGNQYRYKDARVLPPIGLPYPNAFVQQLETNIALTNLTPSAGDWSLSSAAYISKPISHQTNNVPSPILFWHNQQIMSGIDLSDGIQLGEAISVLGYPAYIDIRINNQRRSAPLPPLSPVIKPGFWAIPEAAYIESIENAINGMIDDYFDENTQFNSTRRALSKVRVRSIENQSGNAQIFIAQVETLGGNGSGGSEQQAIVDSIREIQGPGGAGTLNEGSIVFPASGNPFLVASFFSATPYEDYFDLPSTYQLAGLVEDAVDLTLSFQSGQHGTQPVIPWQQDQAGTAYFDVENYKSPKIIEIPLGQTNAVQVGDLPPQYPDVDIYPLKGSNRDIKILLNSNFTKGAYMPIGIEPEDTQKFADIRLVQGRPTGPILFSSDDSNIKFQVYRTTETPSSYQSFLGKLHFTKEAKTPSGKRLESMSLVDRIEPNVNYYYCFRTIDKNGYPSNPSPILRVQMVDDNGRIYPIIEAHTIDASTPRTPTRSFKKYLEIDTSLQERIIVGTDPDSAGNPDTAPTGVSMGTSDGTFGSTTTYKVRIISRDTGRKIDLNLNFNVETIPNPKLPGN